MSDTDRLREALDDPEQFGWRGLPQYALAYAAAIRDVRAYLAASADRDGHEHDPEKCYGCAEVSEQGRVIGAEIDAPVDRDGLREGYVDRPLTADEVAALHDPGRWYEAFIAVSGYEARTAGGHEAIYEKWRDALRQLQTHSLPDGDYLGAAAPVDRDGRTITGPDMARAWALSGRTAPLMEPDEWEGFALALRAVLGPPDAALSAPEQPEDTRPHKVGCLLAPAAHDGFCPTEETTDD